MSSRRAVSVAKTKHLHHCHRHRYYHSHRTSFIIHPPSSSSSSNFSVPCPNNNNNNRHTNKISTSPFIKPASKTTPAATGLYCIQKRCIHIPISIEGLALAPVVFGGLFVALWTWKCLMMITFQNKIIYMPGLPPNSRREKITDYEHRLCGIDWREDRITAADGTELALCLADVVVDVGKVKGERIGEGEGKGGKGRRLYVLYFQGNAASIPPRLPDLSSTLSMLKRQLAAEQQHASATVTMACLSYRGYWTSRGRPTEAGIRLDARAALEWITRLHHSHLTGNDNATKFNLNDSRRLGRSTCNGDSDEGKKDHNSKASTRDEGDKDGETTPPAEVILWGQSIGSGVATNLAADTATSVPENQNVRITGLILETPFTSIRAMLEVLYPQKWLPYKYLWPFLRNHLDSWANMGLIADACRRKKQNCYLKQGQTQIQIHDGNEKGPGPGTGIESQEDRVKMPDSGEGKGKSKKGEYRLPEILILQAAKDELVPAELTQKLHDRCQDLDFPVSRVAVDGAFHNDVMFRPEGKKAVARFLARKIMEL